jgi:hypothetical protein
MKRLILLVLLLALPAHAAEVLVPAATPTPDTDAVAYYTWSQIHYFNQVFSADGTQAQPVHIDVVYVGLRPDGNCAVFGPNHICRTVTRSYYDATAATLLAGLDGANFASPNSSFSKQVMLFGISQGILPAGSVAGTPGITIRPTPTP